MKRLSLLLAVSLLFVCQVARSQTLPSGFSTTTIGSGWNLPLGTAFTNDGQKMFVWEKDGRVYVCNRNGAGAYIKQTTPVLDISEEVANWGDHGLMGFALDPNYLSNGLIYLLYVVDRHYLMNFGTPSYNPATSSTGATIGRITRYKTTTSGSNIVIDPASRFILLGETRQTGICIMHDSHGLGTLAFAADGTLLATAGDAGSYYLVDKGSDTDTDFQTALNDGIIRPAENVGAFRAQILNSHNGKLLRIDPVTGNGVSSNPYYSAAQPRSPKSRVWALGLRNPYRFSIKAGTGSTNPAAGDVGEILVGDVGWNTYEEVTIISTPGVNCGWPLFEGLTPQPGYTSALTANLDEPNPLFGIGGCTKQYFNFQDLIKQVTADNNKTVYNSCNPANAIGTGNRYVHFRPSIDWRHFTNEARVGIFSGNTATTAMVGSPESNVIGSPFPGNCATGGPWYTGTNFPAAYQNKYFVADHDGQWIRCFSVDFTDVVTEVKNFGTGFLGTVNVNVNPLDGTLVVVELGNFSTIGPAIKQIRYGGNQSPVVKMTSDKTFGPSALSVNFTGNTSSDPDGTIASYAWNFGDGGTSTLANPSHNFTAPANTPTKYVVKLTVTDNLGASSLDSIIISVNNTPPVVNITSPVKNSLYKVGPDTLYTCSATVNDAEHNAAALKYEWQTILRHNSHAHPEGISTATSTTTNISRIGCNGDDYYWLIRLTVTDAAGLSTVDSSKIFPDCSPGVDNTPPVVSTVSPLNGATNVTTGTNVSAVLNETIDPVTVTGTTFQLKNAANTVIPASINTSFNQLTLTPSAVLAGSTVYTATIKGGSSGVKDLAGNALASDYSWSFTTVAVDLTPPAVTSVLPINGATGVSTGTTVMANFNEAINGSTVTAATVELRNAGNTIIPATITSSSNQIILTPSSPLTGSTFYTATIKGGSSGVKDLSGNALVNDFVWTFTTGAVDNIAPTVVSVLPVNAAIGVSTGAAITVNFSEFVNPSTVTSTTLQLKDASNNIIAATLNTSSNVVTLTPSSALAGSTTYTVTITGGAAGVKDLTGNALASNYSWSFTTVAVIPPALVTIQSFDTKTGVGATVHSLAGVPAGALLVLSTTADAFLSDCIVTSAPSLTWTKRVDAGANQSDNAEIWTAVYSAGGTITVTSNWGAENSETSVCYVVLNAEPILAGAFGTGVLQTAPSVTVNTTRENSILFGCTADWKAINGATRTLRDAATERLYFKDGHYTTYHYTKAATIIAAYTEGVSIPSNQQASTAILEIRGATGATNIIPPTITTQPASQVKCAGTNVSFTTAANGTPVPTVQWQESINGTNWNNITGAVNSTLTFTTAIADNNKQYRAVWTNSAGPVSSNPATLTVNSMAAPVVTVADNCGSSVLTVESIAGTLLWSNGATSSSITITNPGTYTVVQTVDGCISDAGNGIATPKPIPSAPFITVADNCGSSTLTASGFAGSLLWSTGETTASITVVTAGTYTVTQTVNGCISAESSAIASPGVIPSAPTVTVVNNCGHSVLTAGSFTGTLLWSTGETTTTIIVTTADTYTLTQTVDGCISAQGSGIATPIISSVTSPTITVVDNCGSSELTAGAFTGTLLWSTGETTPAITVTTAGTYTVTQTLDGCTSDPASVIAAPKNIPSAPVVTVADNCGNAVLTAESFTGSLLWNTGETTSSITVLATGTYTVTQTLNGCTSTAGSGTGSPKIIPSSPALFVANNCGSSVLTASDFTGSLLWSTGETTASITITTGGTFTVAQTVDGCTSDVASSIAAPAVVPSAPIVTVTDNCGNSVLTASEYAGDLLWSTGETTESITVTTGGTYTVTQTVGGCTSADGSGTAAPKLIPPAPIVTIANNCGNSVLAASGFTGSLLWSTGETTSSITVTTGGTYTVVQTVNGCESEAASGLAEPINSVVTTPTVVVVDDCGQSVLTAEGFTGTLLWSTGETTSSITVANAGTYTLTQTVNGCSSAPASGIATPKIIPGAPTVEVVNNCESSILTASNFTGSLLWSTGETTPFVTVTSAGNYTVTQTDGGCTSAAGNVTASPVIKPTAPSVAVANNCGYSVLTASGFTGALLWSTGETTNSITVTTGGTYTVTQTVNGCESAAGSGLAEPINSIVATPTVFVVNDCGQSVLTAGDFTGTVLWSTGATAPSITVSNAGTYTVTQIVNGCSSAPASGVATPKIIPAAPVVEVVNNCESSALTASGYTGSLLWSTAETASSITVNIAGTYTVTQTVNGCTSTEATTAALPKAKPVAPSVSVVNNCGHSVLTASGFTGSLLWSNGATSSSITVNDAGIYSVTQTVDGCVSDEGSATAAPFNAVVDPPTISIVNDCTNTILTAESFTGALLWSNGATTPSITVSTPGTYTVTQTVNGCMSPAGSGIAAPLNTTIAMPTVTVVDNCGSSVLTAGSFTGSLLWSNGATTPEITVTAGGTYTVTQTINGCTGSTAGSGVAAPKVIPSAPGVEAINNCGNSVLTASGFAGTLLWNTGETTSSIIVNTEGTFTVTQTVDGCSSDAGSVAATPKAIPLAPTVSVVDDCGSSTLTAGSFTGSLTWNNAAATTSITVNQAATYTVTQTVNGCTSEAGTGVAAPKAIPVLSGSLSATAVSGIAFSYIPASTTSGTTFDWTRAAVTGISNAAASGTGNISETLVNTLSTAVNVTYVVTLTANGCINTQNVVVSVSSVPVVTIVSPANGATGVSINSPITANFSEAINGTTVTAATVQIKDAANNIIPATINTSSGLISLAPSSVLTNSITYTVTIKGGASGVKGVAGNAMVNDYVWSFTTVAAPSLPPVTIQSVTTKSGIAVTSHPLTGVPAGALLILATTADAVVSNCIVSSSPALTWTKRVDAGATSSDNAEIWTAVYAAGGSITINSNWGDDNSQTSVCYVVLNAEPVLGGAFATATLQSSPSVTITTTRENSIIFGCTADWKAINGATRTLRDGATERLYFKDGNYTTYYYTKAAATVGAYTEGVSLPIGQQASTALLEIRSVSGVPDITPPIVTSVSPVNGATGVLVNATVSAIFNEAMNAATIGGTTVELRNASNTLVAAAVSYNAATRTVTLTPSTVLGNSTVYTAKIISGASGVKDAAGNALTNDYSWSFTTEAGDITPPTITSVTPTNGATGISISATASAIFNEAMDASTINNSTIELRNASNALVTATVTYNAATRTATLTPLAALSNSMVYTATIKAGVPGVKDIAGNALSIDYSWSFTTLVADLTPPTVVSVTPLNGATGVSVNTTVTAIFNEAMNASTINSSTIELRNASNILITATVSYNAATGTATLTPFNLLANSTLYTAKVISGISGVKDAAGNALAIDYSWSFTTGAAIVQPPVTIQSVTTKTGVVATSHPLTGIPAGALLVLATTADAVVSDCIVSSSPALTWTKRVDAGATSSDNAEIWTAVYAAGGSITITSNWGDDNSQTSVCYVVLNAEPVLGGAFATATLQSSPSVTITTTRENSIIFGCTADWKAINGATRTLRDAATERLYFKDGNYTTYYYTKAAATVGSYTEGVSLPTGQQASTALLEIRSVAPVLTRQANSALPIVSSNSNSNLFTNSLGQNYPNPFEYETHIPFTISAPEKVKLVLFDMNGRVVKVLVNASKDAGKHVVNFNAGTLAKGIYYYRIEAGAFTDIKKLIIF